MDKKEKSVKQQPQPQYEVKLKTVSLLRQKYIEIYVNETLTAIYKIVSDNFKIRRVSQKL